MAKALSLKERSLYENPYKKFEALGASQLTDAELLAIILRTGTRDEDALQLAGRLLSGHEDSILNLIDLSAEELKELPGIGRVKAMELKAVAELAKRIADCKYRRFIDLGRSSSIADYYMESLRHDKQERAVIAMFDSRGAFFRDRVVTIGTVDATLLPAREIFSYAIRENAVYIVLLHNHPSGDPSPSREDITATRELLSLGKMLRIFLIDHIIIGDKTYYSFRENKNIIV